MSALDTYVRDVRRAARVGREPAPDDGAVQVDAARARWRRQHVTHAARRLPPASYGAAAWGGLQDSVPRAGLLGLHARIEAAAPDAWEDTRLVQIWLRWADYIVPRDDVAVFTVGALPRDPAYVAALERLADDVLDLLVAGRRGSRPVRDGLPDLPPSFVRAAAVTGRVHIRWDTRTTEIVGADRPDVDAEDARRQLCRRFLHWHGPAGPQHFARWAGVTSADAATTWQAVTPEMAAVDDEARGRWILASDLDAVLAAERPSGVRLLPDGDPCLVVDPPAPPAAVPRKLLYTLTGRLVVDGDVVGGWGRRGAEVALAPWSPLSRRRRSAIETEAAGLATPIGRPITIRWLVT